MSKSSEMDKKVKLYLLEAIEADSSDINKGLYQTTQELINYCQERFEAEYGWNIDRVGRHKALTDWLQGLALPIKYMNYDILILAGRWDSLPENPTEKQEDKILNNYWNLMAAKLCQLFDGYRVPEYKIGE